MQLFNDPCSKQISKIHANFAATQAMYENFQSLHNRLEHIEHLMQQDGLSNLSMLCMNIF